MCKTMTAMLGTLKVNEVELGGLGKLSTSTVYQREDSGRGVNN